MTLLVFFLLFFPYNDQIDPWKCFLVGLPVCEIMLFPLIWNLLTGSLFGISNYVFLISLSHLFNTFFGSWFRNRFVIIQWLFSSWLRCGLIPNSEFKWWRDYVFLISMNHLFDVFFSSRDWSWFHVFFSD